MSKNLQYIVHANFRRRRPQGKKHKTWDGDAFVSHTGDKLTVISEKGKV